MARCFFIMTCCVCAFLLLYYSSDKSALRFLLPVFMRFECRFMAVGLQKACFCRFITIHFALRYAVFRLLICGLSASRLCLFALRRHSSCCTSMHYVSISF